LVQPLADDKSVTIQADLPETEITGDAGRIAQVVTNLLTNAIRYNQTGGSIQVKVDRFDHTASLSVIDTGVGIAQSDLPHVFERFYRVDKARTREAGGAGLGLAICKTIVEAHGGHIAVTSAENQGTTFTVQLPTDPMI